MRFRDQKNTQDIIVACCILHNMRKEFDGKNEHYTNLEYRRQIEISANIQQPLRLQNYFLENYFN